MSSTASTNSPSIMTAVSKRHAMLVFFLFGFVEIFIFDSVITQASSSDGTSLYSGLLSVAGPFCVTAALLCCTQVDSMSKMITGAVMIVIGSTGLGILRSSYFVCLIGIGLALLDNMAVCLSAMHSYHSIQAFSLGGGLGKVFALLVDVALRDPRGYRFLCKGILLTVYIILILHYTLCYEKIHSQSFPNEPSDKLEEQERGIVHGYSIVTIENGDEKVKETLSQLPWKMPSLHSSSTWFIKLLLLDISFIPNYSVFLSFPLQTCFLNYVITCTGPDVMDNKLTYCIVIILGELIGRSLRCFIRTNINFVAWCLLMLEILALLLLNYLNWHRICLSVPAYLVCCLVTGFTSGSSYTNAIVTRSSNPGYTTFKRSLIGCVYGAGRVTSALIYIALNVLG